MKRYILKRLGFMIVTLFRHYDGHLFPNGTYTGNTVSNPEKLSENQLVILNAKYGFDQPVAIQYLEVCR